MRRPRRGIPRRAPCPQPQPAACAPCYSPLLLLPGTLRQRLPAGRWRGDRAAKGWHGQPRPRRQLGPGSQRERRPCRREDCRAAAAAARAWLAPGRHRLAPAGPRPCGSHPRPPAPAACPPRMAWPCKEVLADGRRCLKELIYRPNPATCRATGRHLAIPGRQSPRLARVCLVRAETASKGPARRPAGAGTRLPDAGGQSRFTKHSNKIRSAPKGSSA